MRGITKASTGYHILESLYKRFQPNLKKYNLGPTIPKTDAVTIDNKATMTTNLTSPPEGPQRQQEKLDAITKYNVNVIPETLTASLETMMT